MFGEGALTVNRLPEFKETLIRELLAKGFGVRETARLAGVEKYTVQGRYAAVVPIELHAPAVTDVSDKSRCHYCGNPVHNHKEAARRTARTVHVFCGDVCRRAFAIVTDERATRNYVERIEKHGGEVRLV